MSATNKQSEHLSSPSLSGVQSALDDIPGGSASPTSMTGHFDTLSGVQTSYSNLHNAPKAITTPDTMISPTISGVQSPLSVIQTTVSGVQTPVCTTSKETSTPALPLVTNEQLSGDKLPDLVRPDLTESNNYSSVLDTVPPIGEHPPDNIFDGCTTEEEFYAVDALLSLSNVRDTVTENSLEENSSLMPIDGNSKYEDINPVTVHLDQVSVDGAIARIVENEGMSEVLGTGTPDSQPVNSDFTGVQATTPTNEEVCDKTDVNNITLSGVQSTLSGGQAPLSSIHIAKENAEGPKQDKIRDSDAAESNLDKKTKGYVKVITHGIKKKLNIEGRSYCCGICGIRKRSAHNLNVHHRKRHAAQMCGVCGKLFELASSLSHHMYTHNEPRFFCEKCSFHCHFESELKKHNVTHHSQPLHQCIRKNCGRWFKHKADLVLHVESHTKELIECEHCDFKTTLQKYLKEHMKSHDNTLPYPCNLCNKRFLWRSGLRAHRIKEHANPKT